MPCARLHAYHKSLSSASLCMAWHAHGSSTRTAPAAAHIVAPGNLPSCARARAIKKHHLHAAAPRAAFALRAWHTLPLYLMMMVSVFYVLPLQHITCLSTCLCLDKKKRQMVMVIVVMSVSSGLTCQYQKPFQAPYQACAHYLWPFA